MPKKPQQPEAPRYQISAHHGLSFSLGCRVLLMLAVVCGLLCLASLSKGLQLPAFTPALKAGTGFFGGMAVVCAVVYYRLMRRSGQTEDLQVGERLISTRQHREQRVYCAEQCLYFADVRDAVGYRKALSGLTVGKHVFYLDGVAYFTEEGVRATVGRSELRAAIVFMRAFQAYAAGHAERSGAQAVADSCYD